MSYQHGWKGGRVAKQSAVSEFDDVQVHGCLCKNLDLTVDVEASAVLRSQFFYRRRLKRNAT